MEDKDVYKYLLVAAVFEIICRVRVSMQIYISANIIKEMELELLTEEDELTRRSNG